MLGQSAAASIHMLMDARPLTPPLSADRAAPPRSRPPSNSTTSLRLHARTARARGLSFRIAAGERVGVVGPSGAGKSTIVRLLLRECVPQSGTVRVGGHDLNQLDADTLLSQIALVSQDIMLFHGTIEDNLRLPPRRQPRAAARGRQRRQHRRLHYGAARRLRHPHR